MRGRLTSTAAWAILPPDSRRARYTDARPGPPRRPWLQFTSTRFRPAPRVKRPVPRRPLGRPVVAFPVDAVRVCRQRTSPGPTFSGGTHGRMWSIVPGPRTVRHYANLPLK